MKRKVSVVLLMSAAIAFSGACAKSREVQIRKADEGISLKKEIPIEGIDLFLVMDESGSMYGEKGTDPDRLRYEAGKYLLQNLLVKKADPSFPHRISLIHFGDEAIAQPLLDLIPAKAGDFAKKISHGKGHLGDTSFIEALKTVKQVSEAAPPRQNRKRIVALFTDGEPDDRRKLGQERYFQEIGEFRQRHLGGFQFYAIGIDKTPGRTRWGRSQRLWEQGIGQENVFFITEMKELYAKYNEVVRRIFEIPEVSPDVVMEEVTFEVQPYLEKLEFHIFPESRELKLGIFRPDQTPVNIGDQDVIPPVKGEGYDILAVQEPRPGIWKYRILEGKGRVLVLRNPVPFKLQLLEPEAIHPLGKPMLLKATFTKEAGGEIREDPNYPLAFTAKVITPKGEEVNVQFLRETKISEVHYADKSVPASEPGAYKVKLTVRGGVKYQTTSTREIFVHSFPYLETVKPAPLMTYPLSDAFDLEVVLKRDNAPTDPEKEFEEHPNNLILAQLKASPYPSESPAIWLNRQEGQAIFRGAIPHEFRKPGRYVIAFQLAGTPRIGDRLRPPLLIETVDFMIRRSGWQRFFLGILFFLGSLLMAGVIWGASFGIWLIRLPKTMANIEVREGENTVFTKYLNAGWLKPIKIPGEEGPLTIWIRVKGPDSLYVTKGGLLSFLTFGLLGRRILVNRNEETDLDRTRRIIFS